MPLLWWNPQGGDLHLHERNELQQKHRVHHNSERCTDESSSLTVIAWWYHVCVRCLSKVSKYQTEKKKESAALVICFKNRRLKWPHTEAIVKSEIRPIDVRAQSQLLLLSCRCCAEEWLCCIFSGYLFSRTKHVSDSNPTHTSTW